MNMTMNITLSVLLGYLLGSISPSAFLSKIKKQNLRDQGTGNLGATNTMIVLGRRYGVLVMLFDIVKAFAAVKLAEWLFPELAVSGILAGSAAVVGHIFPFYLKFKGGKGLASFGGLILGVDALLFLILLVITMACMFIINHSVAMPMSAAVLFPILYSFRTAYIAAVVIAALVSLLIICKHISNVGKARRGEDSKIRQYVKETLFHRNSAQQ